MMATRPGAAMSCGKSTSAAGHLAALGGARQQRAHRGDDAGEHLAVIEFGELGKAAAFRDHQADDVLAARLVDLAHEQIDDAVGEHGDRHVGRAHAPRWCRPAASAWCGPVPGTGSPCRGSRDRSCPWRRRRAWPRRRAASPRSRGRRIRRARRPGSPRGGRRCAPCARCAGAARPAATLRHAAPAARRFAGRSGMRWS